MQAEANLRSQGRANVFLSAAIVVGASSSPVRVRNLSTRGAFVDGDSLPSAGASFRLVRGQLSAEGEVAWAAHGQAGLRFCRDINVADWVKRTGHPGQQRVDDAIMSIRTSRSATAPAPAPSLSWISAELDSICERLAASPRLTADLGEELVRLDALARSLQQMASKKAPSIR